MTESDSDIRIRATRHLGAHQPSIVGYAYALTGDYDVAEDAFQEVAVIVASEPQRVPVDRVEAGRWLRAVARNKALQLRNTTKRHRRGALPPEALAQVAAAFDEFDAHDEHLAAMRSAMARCVEQLRGDARIAIMSRYVDNHSCEHIAAAIGRSVGAVYAILKRTRESLSRCVTANLVEVES